MPHSKELLRRYKGQGLVLIGIHSDPSREGMLKVMKELDMSWPMLFDGSRKVMKSFVGEGYPSFYLVDRKGILRISDIDDSDLDKAVAKLIREKR